MDITTLLELGHRVGDRLVERGETIGVAEGSCGGLVSTALLARPGASAYYRGGGVIYARNAVEGLIAGEIARPEPLRGACEPFASYLAESIALRLRTTWGLGEGGATGPDANPYGDPPGHVWVAVHGPTSLTRHVLTGDDDRVGNMVAFATIALEVLAEALDAD